MRKTDRDRAAIRRDRQHGETTKAYEDRICARLEELTGLRVSVFDRAEGMSGKPAYLVRGWNRDTAADPHAVPLVRISRGTLSAAAAAFEEAAGEALSAGVYRLPSR